MVTKIKVEVPREDLKNLVEAAEKVIDLLSEDQMSATQKDLKWQLEIAEQYLK